MQELKVYVSAAGTVGVVRDFANAKNSSLPTLVKGVETCLKLRLFSNTDGFDAYPIEQLSGVASWQWVMDRDFNEETNYILVADNANITVSKVTESIGDTEYTYTEVSIPLPNTNTVELDEWLGTEKSKPGLTAELVGYNAEGDAVFVLQLENFSVRNRLTSAGDPTEIPSEYWGESEIRAFVIGVLRNPLEIQFSTDGASWHDAQSSTDKYFRQRIGSINADWSGAIRLPEGAPGADGKTPVKGVDYCTEADKQEVKDYIDLAVENAVRDELVNGEW